MTLKRKRPRSDHRSLDAVVCVIHTQSSLSLFAPASIGVHFFARWRWFRGVVVAAPRSSSSATAASAATPTAATAAPPRPAAGSVAQLVAGCGKAPKDAMIIEMLSVAGERGALPAWGIKVHKNLLLPS